MIYIIFFRILCESDLELVLKWRTSPHVTKFMYTDIESNIENQKKWFNKIKDDKTQKHWIIQFKEEKIGLISLSKIDTLNQHATSGFYIGDMKYAMLASRVLPYFLNYVFFDLELNKLYIEVMSNNKNMLKMDYHYGFRHVGTMEKHIYKNGQFHDIEILELLKDKWVEEFGKYHKLKANIEGVK